MLFSIFLWIGILSSLVCSAPHQSPESTSQLTSRGNKLYDPLYGRSTPDSRVPTLRAELSTDSETKQFVLKITIKNAYGKESNIQNIPVPRQGDAIFQACEFESFTKNVHPNNKENDWGVEFIAKVKSTKEVNRFNWEDLQGRYDTLVVNKIIDFGERSFGLHKSRGLVKCKDIAIPANINWKKSRGFIPNTPHQSPGQTSQ